MLDQDVGGAGGMIERHLAGQHLKQDAAERILVGALVDVGVVSLLWRHVVRRADHRAGLGMPL